MKDTYIEQKVDQVFQAVMEDIGRRYKVSDTLSDILSDSLWKHLETSISQALQSQKEKIIEIAEGLKGLRHPNEISFFDGCPCGKYPVNKPFVIKKITEVSDDAISKFIKSIKEL